jgi:hypothetical protein
MQAYDEDYAQGYAEGQPESDRLQAEHESNSIRNQVGSKSLWDEKARRCDAPTAYDISANSARVLPLHGPCAHVPRDGSRGQGQMISSSA